MIAIYLTCSFLDYIGRVLLLWTHEHPFWAVPLVWPMMYFDLYGRYGLQILTYKFTYFDLQSSRGCKLWPEFGFTNLTVLLLFAGSTVDKSGSPRKNATSPNHPPSSSFTKNNFENLIFSNCIIRQEKKKKFSPIFIIITYYVMGKIDTEGHIRNSETYLWARGEAEGLITVSYTHLTLPTTPYV